MTIERLDFAYSTLAATTRHKPMLSAFRRIAVEELGISNDKFEAWASTKEWTR